jgi:uncharacterized UPF0160 family protein
MKKAANAIDKISATKEVDNWLDYRRVRVKKRKENEDSINELIEAFEEGILVLDPETRVITQNLIWEVGTKKALTFKPLLTVGDSQRRLQSVKSTDGHAMLAAYVAELTGENSGIIGGMNTEDYGISRTIAGFFF